MLFISVRTHPAHCPAPCLCAAPHNPVRKATKKPRPALLHNGLAELGSNNQAVHRQLGAGCGVTAPAPAQTMLLLLNCLHPLASVAHGRCWPLAFALPLSSRRLAAAGGKGGGGRVRVRSLPSCRALFPAITLSQGQKSGVLRSLCCDSTQQVTRSLGTLRADNPKRRPAFASVSSLTSHPAAFQPLGTCPQPNTQLQPWWCVPAVAAAVLGLRAAGKGGRGARRTIRAAWAAFRTARAASTQIWCFASPAPPHGDTCCLLRPRRRPHALTPPLRRRLTSALCPADGILLQGHVRDRPRGE